MAPDERATEELRDLRVALVAGTLGQGGAERQLHYICTSLLRAGARPHVYCLTEGEFWQHPIEEAGAKVTWIGQKPGRLRRLSRLRRELISFQPNVVHSQHFYTNPYAVAAGRLIRQPVVASVRNDLVSELKAHPTAPVKTTLRLSNTVAANSSHALDRCRQLGIPEERLFLLENVIDTKTFTHREQPTVDSPHLLFVGRLVHQKRPDIFVELIRDLRTRGIPVEATMVGDGPEREGIEALIHQRNLPIRLVGTIPDVRPHLLSAALLVLTSEHEGTPNVVLEAMAIGLPTVAFDIPGPRALLSDDCGRLVKSFDPGSMADVIQGLLDSPSTLSELASRARSRVESFRALDGLPGQLARLYRCAGIEMPRRDSQS